VIDFGLPRRRWKTEDHEGWNHTGADIALPTGVLIGSRISGCLIPAGLDGPPRAVQYRIGKVSEVGPKGVSFCRAC
jgi:hypothetical protein